MKELKAFIKKEFLHIFRDWRTLIVIFAIPAIQIIVFGYAISNDVKYVSVGIWDKANDELSRKIIAKLKFSEFFKVNAIINNDNEIEKLLKSNKVKEVIIIESDFSKKLLRERKANIQIIADATEANTSNLSVNYTTEIINSFAKEMASSIPKPPGKTVTVINFYRARFPFIPGEFKNCIVKHFLLFCEVEIHICTSS